MRARDQQKLLKHQRCMINYLLLLDGNDHLPLNEFLEFNFAFEIISFRYHVARTAKSFYQLLLLRVYLLYLLHMFQVQTLAQPTHSDRANWCHLPYYITFWLFPFEITSITLNFLMKHETKWISISFSFISVSVAHFAIHKSANKQ